MASPKILELSPLHAFLGIQSPEPPAGLRILSWNNCTKTCFLSSKASRIGENIWRDVTHVEVITEDLWMRVNSDNRWWPSIYIFMTWGVVPRAHGLELEVSPPDSETRLVTCNFCRRRYWYIIYLCMYLYASLCSHHFSNIFKISNI